MRQVPTGAGKSSVLTQKHAVDLTAMNNEVTLANGDNAGSMHRQLYQLKQMMLLYEAAMDAVTSRVEVLQEDFRLLHDYNPIEHVKSRLKSAESILGKAQRKGLELTVTNLMNSLYDIAGVRLTCSFPSDLYTVRDLLLSQPDLRLVEEKDYVSTPKPNGYKSLHLIIQVPVHLSTGTHQVPVEVQLRTIAMDFWASLEHKIYYKYDHDVPKHLTDALKLAADVADTLDTSMERIHREVQNLDQSRESSEVSDALIEALLRRGEDPRP